MGLNVAEKSMEELLSSAIYKKYHEKTITENINYFDAIIKMLRSINPALKIYLVLQIVKKISLN